MSEYDPAFPGLLNCTNLRFTDVDTLSTEQKLFDNYWKELINLYGVGLNYQVHRYDKTKADNLYGEHSSQEYADPIEVLALIELQENALSLSKYGFVTDDQITLYFHIQTYTDIFEPLGIYQEVNQKYIAPKAGDIFELYEFGKTRPLGLGGKKFIVTERTDQDVGMNINQLAGHYVWVVKAKRYDPSYEPNVNEEPESYQVFDEDYAGRIVDNAEVKEQPSEQKQYEYSIETENKEKVFDYAKHLIDTSVYGEYVRGYFDNSTSSNLPWYATTDDILEFTEQPVEKFVNGQYFECSMQSEYGTGKQAIRIPRSYQLQYVEVYNTIDNTWNIIGNNKDYSVSLYSVKDIIIQFGSDLEPYTQYTYTGPTVGNRQLRFYVIKIDKLTDDYNVSDMPWYATTEQAGVLSLQSSKIIDDQYFECELQPEYNNSKQAIQIPGKCILDYVKLYNPITQSWDIIGNNKEYSKSLFDISNIKITLDNKEYNYSLTTYIGPNVGKRKLQFYVTINNPQPNAIYPWFATTSNIMIYTQQPESLPFEGKYFECELAAETGKFKQSIQIPASYSVNMIQIYDVYTNKWIEQNIDSFAITTINKIISNNNITYNQYTNTSINHANARIIRFYI